MTPAAAMASGFLDPALSAQATFRILMDAMARPGKILRLSAASGCPAPLMRGTASIALTLFDQDTPIWLDDRITQTSHATDWIKFHTGAPVLSNPSVCSFALIADAATLPEFTQFGWGTEEYPDRSTTVIAQIESLNQGRLFEMQGPGIDGVAELRLPIDLTEQAVRNAARFPCGIDLVLVADDAMLAIPRTTRLVTRKN